jgi:hypothetical protein
MKKIYLIAITLLLVGSYSAQAQLIQFGVKGGVNFPTINEQGTVSYTYEANTGWHAGLAVQLKIPIVKVGAEFLYSSNKAVQSVTLDELKTAHFTIPVFAKLSFLKIIQIHTGPQFSFIMSAEEGGNDIKDQWDSKAFNWMAGAGVQLGPLDVHARFIFPQSTTMSTVSNEYKNSDIQVSAIYWFGGKKD